MGLFGRRRHNRYTDADRTQPSIESSMTTLSMLADDVVSTATQIKQVVKLLREQDEHPQLSVRPADAADEPVNPPAGDIGGERT